ncbi:hypothetical protein [Paenibacillus sp. FSL R7-0273]|uniref:hypothetical protein n=1 Tax=Paenibacillus sp. FSL R7-0273 TaxID=1536772 RepID=UPI000AF27C05|nr:hypothetical protein [Paenibacillus sp. FSL R7-0273]
MMNYGSTACALEYAGRGAISEWVQLFLRNDGKNVVFADGLLLEPRYYAGPVQTDISLFGIEEGAPSYVKGADEIEYFFQVVEGMKRIWADWDFPPLIVNYCGGRFEINDGRHRNVALHQMGIKLAPDIFWTSSEEDRDYILEYIRRCS